MKIRTIRKRLNLTQEQFAHKLGVSFVTVNRWENRRHKPTPLAQLRLQKIMKRMK